MRLPERLLQDDPDGPKKDDPIVSWIIDGGVREAPKPKNGFRSPKAPKAPTSAVEAERCEFKLQALREAVEESGGDPSLVDGWSASESARVARWRQPQWRLVLSVPSAAGLELRQFVQHQRPRCSYKAVVDRFQTLGMMGPMRTGNKRAVDFSADAVAHHQDDHSSDDEPLDERGDRVDATQKAAKKLVEAARQKARAEGLELRKGAKGYEGVYRTEQGAFRAIWRQEGVLDKHLGFCAVAEEAALLVARERKSRSTGGAAGASSSGEAGASSSSSPGASSSGASPSRASAALAAAEAEGLTLETNETSQSGYKYVLVDNAAGGNGKAAARYRVNVKGVLVQGGFGTPEEAALELARARRAAAARAAAEAVAVNEQRGVQLRARARRRHRARGAARRRAECRRPDRRHRRQRAPAGGGGARSVHGGRTGGRRR